MSVATLLFVAAWVEAGKLKYNSALWLLLLGGLLIRIYTASDFYLHEWDERFHALVSKNMMEAPFKPLLYKNPVLPYNPEDWSKGHVWLHKQPFPLWCMTLSMSIFGINELALRLPSILLSTLGIALLFFIGRYLFNKKIAFVAAFLFAIHGLIVELTAGRVATDHVDIFFLFFIEAAIALTICYLKTGRTIFNVLVGICIGLAVLSKWLPAFVVFPIWGMLLLQQKKSLGLIFGQGFLVFGISVLVFLPWQIYTAAYFPKEMAIEQAHNYRHLTEVLDGQGGHLLYHFNNMRILFGELIYLPMLWFLFICIRKRNFHYWALALWVLIPYLFFTIAKTKMQGYILFTAPAIFMITAYFWYFLKQNRKQFKYPILVNVVLLLLIALPIRYSIERIKPFANRERFPESVQALKSFAASLAVSSDKLLIFGTPMPIETMFYVGGAAYEAIPDASALEQFKKEGYEIYFYKEGKYIKLES